MMGSRARRRHDRSHSRDCAPGAPRLLRTVATAAVLLVVVALSSVPGAQAVCCLCENLVGNQDNCGPVQIPDCDLCATACSSQGGTVRKCCPDLANCGDGGADACNAVTNVCYESTAGFCDGTCTGPTETPTHTPVDTPTATPIDTPTATPTNTGIPSGGSCTESDLCASGFCADMGCCDTACDDPLQACNIPGHVGTCTTLAAAAPATSTTGLMVAGLVLTAIGALAFARRRPRATHRGSTDARPRP